MLAIGTPCDAPNATCVALEHELDSSSHRGGVNVLFGDGHVPFVDEGIDLPAWWSMGTRNGGEPHRQGS